MSSSSSTMNPAKTPLLSLDTQGDPRSGTHSQARRVMLLLAAGTTLYGVTAFYSLGGLLESDDAEDDTKDDLLEIAIQACRVWSLATAVAGGLAVRGVLQKHFPSLRVFAIHALIDTILTGLTVLCFALVLLVASPAHLGHTVCEHLSRGDALGIVISPGSGLELCEEKFSYGVAPLILLLGGIALFLRTKTALYIWDFYRTAVTEGKICLESPSSSPRHSQDYPSSSSAHHRSSSRHRTNTSSSGRHSRSSSASTVRPLPGQAASRIMLLPADYDSSRLRTPSLQIVPPSPLSSSNSSVESFETIKAFQSNVSRKRSMSYDSGSNPHNNVIVYAPILMSIDEAQSLGGREAVIASALSNSPTSYGAATTSPRHRTSSPPAAVMSQARRESGSEIKTPTMAQSGAFSALKGFRDTTELDNMANTKSL